MTPAQRKAGEEDTKITPALQQLIDYVQKNDLRDEIIQFMQEKYGNELNAQEPQAQEKPGVFQRAQNLFKRKATTEEIKRIFTSMLSEEREARLELLRRAEHTHLGRTRK